MISRRITFSALFILILVASLFAGLTSCSGVLLQKESTDFALSFVAPGASSGRAADGAAHWNVTAWLELEDGTRLQSQQTAAMAREPVAIPFAPVAAGTRLKVKVELVSAQPPLQKYAGESEFMEVLPGEKTVRLELKLVDAELEEDAPPPESEEGEKEEPSIVNADTPTITAQPVGETKPFAAGQATAVTKELTVKASVSDGGTLTYQWYSNTSNSTTDGTPIEGATSSSYEATVNAKETKYFYCIVTNTNNSVSGAKTADIITSVVAVASVEGELASIAAKYTGSQGYMLVGQINHNDFTVTETYTSGTERVDVTVTPNENSYSIDATNGDSAEAIGQVPYTVTRIGTNVTTTAVVPIKYELDVNNLTIIGGATVEQNGNLKLTAGYKADGNDVQYKLYDESSSSNTYKVTEKVSISWTGDVQQSSAWEAFADTATAGQKTATVKLISTDEWCVATEGIQANHQYTVNALVNAATPDITEQPVGETKLADDSISSWTKKLNVTARSTDGGVLSYQWYSNNTNSTTGGTRIEGATNASYTPGNLNRGDIRYFYCEVTNTNTQVNGTTATSITTNVVVLAFVEGTLTSITATYHGSQGKSYMLVDSFSFDDFSVTGTYTANGQSITKKVTSLDGQYTFSGQSDDSGVLYVGNVPLTITNSSNPTIQAQVTVPIKYELDVSNLTITGDTTVEQNGNLKLTAGYKADGNDVQYKLYDESSSSNTYKVTEKVSISWTGDVQQSSAWEAFADTATAGQKTATVKLISTDEWCVATEGIQANHQYTVNALVNAATPDITEQPVGETKLADDSISSWTKKLNVTARSTDGGVLSYQWYSNNTNSTTGGTRIEGATNASYTPGNLNRGDIRYFYCEVTNTNTQVNGTTATSVTTNVVVLAFVGGTLTSGPSNQAELVQAIADAPEGDKITINNTIVITDTLVIDKYIIIEGSGDISLLRDNTGTITGPMIEVKKGGTLELSSITLDGQWNKSYTNGENNPLIYVNTGTLGLNGVTLKNNHMAYSGAYTDKNDQSVDLYAAAAIYALDSQLMILNSTFTDFSANSGKGGVINIEGTSPGAGIAIINSTVEACGGPSSRALQMGSTNNVFDQYIGYVINDKQSGLSRQIASITPTSPSP